MSSVNVVSSPSSYSYFGTEDLQGAHVSAKSYRKYCIQTKLSHTNQFASTAIICMVRRWCW